MSKKSKNEEENNINNQDSINTEIPIGQGVDLANSILGSNNEDEFYKALKEMYKTTGETDIRTKTTFPDALVNKIIRLIVWSKEAERFDKADRDYPKITSLIDNIIINNLYALRISAKGKGREEFFDSLKAKKSNDEKSKLQRMFGIGNR